MLLRTAKELVETQYSVAFREIANSRDVIEEQTAILSVRGAIINELRQPRPYWPKIAGYALALAIYEVDEPDAAQIAGGNHDAS